LEGFETDQMTLDLSQINDVRQSAEWGIYLHNLGWQTQQTSGGISVNTRPSPFGGLVKVQKPKPFGVTDLADIENIAREHKASLIKLEPYVGQNLQVLSDAGYTLSKAPLTPTATFLIDLTLTEAELWNKLSHSAKYSINRAKREGVHIEIIRKPSAEKIAEFYDIVKATGKRKHFFIPSIKFTQEQANAFGDNGFLFVAYNAEGKICSEKWHVGSGDFVLYVSGGTTPEGLDDKSGYLIVWTSILYFKSLGYKVLDLEGKYDARFPGHTKHWGGFTDFKEKFGGLAVEFPEPRIKYFNKLLKFLSQFPMFEL
jgi:lipid II:glycine glycyltransferase (peptidoglycan interpeptide bridge formation enzyme)